MKKFFLLLLIYSITTYAGFGPSTDILVHGYSFRKICSLRTFDWINCFVYNNDGSMRTDSYRPCGLSSYEAPIGIRLWFGLIYWIDCDPQQLFRLYHNYEWIRACDIEPTCLLLDYYGDPVPVTKIEWIQERCVFYKFKVPFLRYYNFFVSYLKINVCDYQD